MSRTATLDAIQHDGSTNMARPDCLTCNDAMFIGTGNDERACPECQPLVAAQEARDRRAGF